MRDRWGNSQSFSLSNSVLKCLFSYCNIRISRILLQVWLIDVSQSVEPAHPHGLEFLFRDCRNVSTVSVSLHNVLLSSYCFYFYVFKLIITFTAFFIDSAGSFHSVLLHTIIAVIYSHEFFPPLKFFQKAGVTEAMHVYELFNTVSGLKITSDNEADFLAQVSVQ